MSTIKVPEEYKTISEALNISNPGDEIIVNGGNYNEQINIGESITLVGINKPMIKFFPTNGRGVINFSSRGSIVDGFIIQGIPVISDHLDGPIDSNLPNNVLRNSKIIQPPLENPPPGMYIAHNNV